MNTKTCKACGEDKPTSEFHRKAPARDGLQPKCKTCVSEYGKAWYKANRADRLEKAKAWERDNRDRVEENLSSYREANRERLAAEARDWYWANRERCLEVKREYHAEKWESDPEFRSKRYADHAKRRRLLSTAVQVPYLREDIFSRDGWVCQICREAVDPSLKWPSRGAATIDHVVPVSKGGHDTPENVQLAHAFCNTSKGNRTS